VGLFDRAKEEVVNEEMDGLNGMQQLVEEHRARTSWSPEADRPTTDELVAEEPFAPEAAQVDDALEREDVERPSWLPSQFVSAEDLAKSYREAQSELTRSMQERAVLVDYTKALLDQVEALQQGIVPQQVEPPRTTLTPSQKFAAIQQRVSQVQAPFAPRVEPGSDEWNEAVTERLGAVAPNWNDETAARVQTLIDRGVLPAASISSPDAYAVSLAQLA